MIKPTKICVIAIVTNVLIGNAMLMVLDGSPFQISHFEIVIHVFLSVFNIVYWLFLAKNLPYWTIRQGRFYAFFGVGFGVIALVVIFFLLNGVLQLGNVMVASRSLSDLLGTLLGKAAEMVQMTLFLWLMSSMAWLPIGVVNLGLAHWYRHSIDCQKAAAKY